MQYQGQDVRSRMQESLLLEMAQLTGGAYVPAGTRAIELDRIYTERIAPKARRAIDATTRERWTTSINGSWLWPWCCWSQKCSLVNDARQPSRVSRTAQKRVRA